MLGIFLEPKGDLKKFIYQYKKKINSKYLDTNYTNHPPHLSIYVSKFSNTKKVILELEKIILKIKPFKIKLNKTDIFYDDFFTKKDTIFLKLNKNKKIFILQKILAERLKKYVRYKSKKKLNLKNNILKRSITKFGFPFIGSHWIPHFTISSIKNFKNSKDCQKFLNTKVNFENSINSISLWKINKNKHIKIRDFKFQNASKS